MVAGIAVGLTSLCGIPWIPWNVAGISETTGWRMGHTILQRSARLLLPERSCPFSKMPSLVPSLIASASSVTGGSGGDIPVAAYFLLQCHLPVCGDRKPGAVPEQHLPQYAGLH